MIYMTTKKETVVIPSLLMFVDASGNNYATKMVDLAGVEPASVNTSG